MATSPDAPQEGSLEEITVKNPRLKKRPPNSPPISPNNTFNVFDFISKINRGLSKPNKFKVKINVGENTTLSNRWSKVLSEVGFFCDAAELPGRTLNSTDIKIHGPTFKAPNLSQYSDLTLTVLCDPYLNQKVFFEDWINFINPEPNFFFRYRNSYIGTVEVIQYNEFAEEVYNVKFLEAYPITLNPMPLSWADDGVHRVQVVFTYRYWTIGTAGTYQPPKSINDINTRASSFSPGSLA